MRINFISFLDPFVHSGGGELLTRKIINVGRERGHEINQFHLNPPTTDSIEKSDLNILWDVFNCPEQGYGFNPHIIKIISSSTPYVYGTGGYEDFCLLGTLPCQGATDGENCNVELDHPTFGPAGINRPHPGVCIAKERSFLYHNAKGVVLFSPVHHVHTVKALGHLDRVLIAMPPFEGAERFFDRGIERTIELLSYGGHMEYKGFFNIMERFPDKTPVFIGGGPTDLIQKYNYGKYLGNIAYENMPKLLNQVQKYLYMPRWPEPCGLTTLQALLCGCELELNENSDFLADKSREDILKEIELHREAVPIWEFIEDSV